MLDILNSYLKTEILFSIYLTQSHWKNEWIMYQDILNKKLLITIMTLKIKGNCSASFDKVFLMEKFNDICFMHILPDCYETKKKTEKRNWQEDPTSTAIPPLATSHIHTLLLLSVCVCVCTYSIERSEKKNCFEI